MLSRDDERYKKHYEKIATIKQWRLEFMATKRCGVCAKDKHLIFLARKKEYNTTDSFHVVAYPFFTSKDFVGLTKEIGKRFLIICRGCARSDRDKAGSLVHYSRILRTKHQVTANEN